MPAGTETYDVFVSYSRADGRHAAEIDSVLRDKGLKTFFDRRNLAAGLPWVRALEQAIGAAQAAIVLIGPRGLGNTQQYERELAFVRQTRDSKFRVVPVLLPDTRDPPFDFLQVHTWIDFSHVAKVHDAPIELEHLVTAVRSGAISGEAVRDNISPYRGLEPFREEDAALFCGRDDAIRDLVAHVQTYSFVTVVGPSGCGKSSLVFAGLLPSLRQQRESTVWDVVSFRPGASPLRALATAFGTVPENAGPAAVDTYLENEAAAYRAGDAGKLARIVNDRLDSAPEKADRLLIYVDQWEELYAMAPTSEDLEQRNQHSSDIEKFITLLVSAASGQKSRATIVLTVRADFYNPLVRNAQLSTLLPRQQVNIPPMSPSDLRAAIETPAKKAGLFFSPPALVDQIMNDVGTEEGRLPLLQFALKEIWEKRESDRLTAKAYTEVGGVSGAIQKTAERTYASLTPGQQEAARRLFLRLVTPGEGREDTRARSPIPDDPQQRDIVNLFSNPRTRLLVIGHETLQGPTILAGRDVGPTVEVAHEALIRRWETLKAWVDANREKLRARAAILRAKVDWEEKGRRNDMLLPVGLQVERARSLLADPGDITTDDIKEFISLSSAREESERKKREDALARDEARVAQIRAAQDRRETERKLAIANESRALAALSQAASLRGRYTDAVKLALAAWPRSAADERPQLSRTIDALAQALSGPLEVSPPLRHKNWVNTAAFSPDGARVLTASGDQTARVWDGATGASIGKPLPHDHDVTSAAFSPDGARIVTASDDNTVRVWDAATRAPIGQPLRHTRRVESATFSPDGVRVVTVSDDTTAQVWDTATGAPIGNPMRHKETIRSAALSPDGKRVVTASFDRSARVWDADTGTPIGEPMHHDHIVESAAFSPDGARVVTASSDRSARVWDAATGAPIGKPLLHDHDVTRAAFSPDSARVVTVSTDNAVRVWDAATGVPIGKPLKHERWIASAAFSPDGARVVTASFDNTAQVWDAATGTPFGKPMRHEDLVHSAAFSPDGARVVTASKDWTARVWDAATGAPIGETVRQDHAVLSAAFSPDGTRLVTVSDDNVARLWAAKTGVSIGEAMRHDYAVVSAAFSPNGARIVTASHDHTAHIWNAATGAPIGNPMRHKEAVRNAAFSPDGALVVTASEDATARVWDAVTGAPIGEPMQHNGTVWRTAFSPDGKRVVTASFDRSARVWDAASGTPIGKPMWHEDAVRNAAFSPDGARVVTASEDRTVRVWDAATGAPVSKSLKHEEAVTSVAFSPDVARVVTFSDNDTAWVWDVATGAPIGNPLKHRETITSAAFSPDGARVATASFDKTAQMWDAATGAPIGAPMRHDKEVWSTAFSPDGARLVTASWDRTARVWRAPPAASNIITTACKMLRDHDVSDLSSRYGIEITNRICGPDAPAPDPSLMIADKTA
jgi:WD40 repeat protein